ncbi:MAG TPA: hypothetical protein VER09_13140 [Pseudomonas sp.]|nr:hypothetical protein [Pseudomonas sp.]
MKRELVCGLLLSAMCASSPLLASIEPAPIAAAMTPSASVCQLPAAAEAVPAPTPASEPAKKLKAPTADAHNLLLLLLLNVAQGVSRR